MKLLAGIPPIFRNKYLLTIIGFAVWMLFVDRNDFFTQIGRYRKLTDLRSSNTYYNQKIEAAKTELEIRKNDPAAYERLAREKYYMKKDNEDIFLFDE